MNADLENTGVITQVCYVKDQTRRNWVKLYPCASCKRLNTFSLRLRSDSVVPVAKLNTVEMDSDVVKARLFWAGANVDSIFDEVCKYLAQLRGALKDCSATDTEYVTGMKLVSLLTSEFTVPVTPSDPFVQVIVCSEVPPVELPESSVSPTEPDQQNGPSSQHTVILSESLLAPTVNDELSPLVQNKFHYTPHKCSKACLPCWVDLHQAASPFWGQNPLKVPLLCGFRRLNALTLETEGGGVSVPWETEGGGGALPWEAGGGALAWEPGEWGNSEHNSLDAPRQDVLYKAPCGLILRSYADVTRFLWATESYDVLQVDFFSFNPALCVDSPWPGGPRHPEQDLSRGTEPTPVELCPGEGGSRPGDFRYRRDRWPHGCFLSRSSMLFQACCDCTDGCADAQRCACVRLTSGGRHYTGHQLTEPVPSGLYECGPWCGCDRASCQNRLVQRGIRVRLQVFQTAHRGWGVRCRDDVDQGTFVCMYAGLVLKRGQGPQETQEPQEPPAKRLQSEQLSDDEVEVVTEWLALPVKEGRAGLSDPLAPASLSLHVPVIQSPADTPLAPPVHACPMQEDQTKPDWLNSIPSCADVLEDQLDGREIADLMTMTRENLESAVGQVSLEKADPQSLKWSREEDMYYLDASTEGNVARFFNHSCQPNMFAQSVFTDSHDPGFPVVAFFTSRMVKAGTELTWKYSSEPESSLGHEVPCQCGSEDCLDLLALQPNHYNTCVVEGL